MSELGQAPQQSKALILIRQGTLISRVSMPPATSYLAGDLITPSSLLALEDGEDPLSCYHFTIGRHSYTCPVSHAVLLESSSLP